MPDAIHEPAAGRLYPSVPQRRTAPFDPVDTVSKEARSRIMSRIGGKNTKPEISVRSFLHRQGMRFRIHVRSLPGTPDVVLPKYKAVVFVNGCFWHGHDHPSCKKARLPSSNIEYWDNKIKENRARGERDRDALHAMGWRVLVVWECELSQPETLEKLPALIRGQQGR